MKKRKLLKRILYSLGAMILALLILLGIYIAKNITDYQRFKEETYKKNSEIPQASAMPDWPSHITQQLNLHNPAQKTSEKDLSGVIMKLEASYQSEFEGLLRDMRVVYPYEDLFAIDETLTKYEQLDFTIQSHDLDVLDSTGEVDVSAFVNKVLGNNKVYLRNQKPGMNFYKEMKLKEIEQICGIIAEVYNYHSRNNLIDANKAACNLSALKIFLYAQPSMGSITKDLCLLVNPEMIKVLQMMTPDVEGFEQTIVHETMHLFQSACIHMKEANGYEMNYGNSYSWEDLLINPLMWSWHVEASAEKNNSLYTGNRAVVYHHMIGYLESLSLATILNDDVQVHQTERMTLKTGKIDILFDQFDCVDDQQRNEIINMMYSIEIMQNDREDFLNLYKSRYNKELSAPELENYKFTMKNEIMATLTKAFYLNLSGQIASKGVSLQDIFYLITVFESDINSHVKYTKMQQCEYIQDFLLQYINIQDAFFEALSKSNNYDIDELLNLYESYGLKLLKDGEALPNNTLDWLAPDKKEYILEREAYLRDFCTANIRNAYIILRDFTKSTN